MGWFLLRDLGWPAAGGLRTLIQCLGRPEGESKTPAGIDNIYPKGIYNPTARVSQGGPMTSGRGNNATISTERRRDEAVDAAVRLMVDKIAADALHDAGASLHSACISRAN